MTGFKNPLSGVGFVALAAAGTTAIGAAIRGNDVHSESLTAMVGGVIGGTIAGLTWLTDNNTPHEWFNVCMEVMTVTTYSLVYFLSPVIGERVLKLGTNMGMTVLDESIGLGVTTIAAVGVTAVAVAATSNCTSDFFKSSVRSLRGREPEAPGVAAAVAPTV